MNINTQSPLQVLALSLLFIFHFSCSKDYDLLADYVLVDADAKEALIGKRVVDDTFIISQNGSIVLDVLSNDAFENQTVVVITEVSTPTNGTVVVNNDETITYTPDAEIFEQIMGTTNTTTVVAVDTFSYTTEVVNDDASVRTETANVTVTISINSKAENDYDTVENISALLELERIDGLGMNVLGYYAPDDGGGGIFMYDATQSGTNNGGIILNGWVRQYTGALNAKWWGATGDGTTDDQPAISAALHYAYDNSLDIFFPEGDYLFATEEDYYGIKHGFVDDSSGKSFRLFGEKGTKFTTSMDGSNGNFRLLGFFGSTTNNIVIEYVEFENTHGLTTNNVVGIYLQSSNGHENMIIRNCHFHGWSTAISVNGTKNLLIENNKFTAPLGHDNATNNTNPATFVRFTSNEYGINQDALIRNNYVEGYSGTDITTTTSKKAMDGFVYSAANSGGCNGMIIEGNTLLNLSEEAIAVSSYLYYDPSAVLKPIIIRNNFIDSTFPSGTTHDTNYGILADSPNTNIYGNTIKAAYAILIYPVNEVTQSKDISIHHNKIYLTNDTVGVLKAIFMAGYATAELYPIENVSVTNNDIYVIDLKLPSDTKLIHTADIVNVTIKDNKFFIENVMLGSFDLNIYEFAQNSDNIEYGRESIVGSYSNLVVSDVANTGITYISASD